MYGKTKLKRRQIKEDRFAVFMLNARQQFLDYWQYVVIGIVAVVLVIVGVVYYFNSLEAKKVEAAQRFARALQDYGRGNTQVAIMGLNQLLEDDQGSDIAEQATFLLGNINLEARNYPEAIRYCEMYLANYADNRFHRASALAGIATCLENQGQYADAAARFEAAYQEYPEGPLNGDYRLSAMRNCLAVGDTERAQTHLEFIEENFKGTSLAMRAARIFSEKRRSS
ncbi:MAG: tetratricopeptide repeat protein [Candidatus Zixiibacteriota bacterium]